MERTRRGPTLHELELKVAALEHSLRETTSMLALVAFTQEDKQISFGVEDLKLLPPGSYVDVTFDKLNQMYVLRWQPADAPELPGARIKSVIEV